MKKSWTKGLDSQAEADLRGNFVASLVMRKRLEELIQDKMTTSITSSRSKSDYENPNWAFIQADHRGYERALHELLDLIK